jgi:hypothetical protein
MQTRDCSQNANVWFAFRQSTYVVAPNVRLLQISGSHRDKSNARDVIAPQQPKAIRLGTVRQSTACLV